MISPLIPGILCDYSLVKSKCYIGSTRSGLVQHSSLCPIFFFNSSIRHFRPAEDKPSAISKRNTAISKPILKEMFTLSSFKAFELKSSFIDLPLSQAGMLFLRRYIQIAYQKQTSEHFIFRESRKSLFYNDLWDYFRKLWFDRYSEGRPWLHRKMCMGAQIIVHDL